MEVFRQSRLLYIFMFVLAIETGNCLDCYQCKDCGQTLPELQISGCTACRTLSIRNTGEGHVNHYEMGCADKGEVEGGRSCHINGTTETCVHVCSENLCNHGERNRAARVTDVMHAIAVTPAPWGCYTCSSLEDARDASCEKVGPDTRSLVIQDDDDFCKTTIQFYTKTHEMRSMQRTIGKKYKDSMEDNCGEPYEFIDCTLYCRYHLCNNVEWTIVLPTDDSGGDVGGSMQLTPSLVLMVAPVFLRVMI